MVKNLRGGKKCKKGKKNIAYDLEKIDEAKGFYATISQKLGGRPARFVAKHIDKDITSEVQIRNKLHKRLWIQIGDKIFVNDGGEIVKVFKNENVEENNNDYDNMDDDELTSDDELVNKLKNFNTNLNSDDSSDKKSSDNKSQEDNESKSKCVSDTDEDSDEDSDEEMANILVKNTDVNNNVQQNVVVQNNFKQTIDIDNI